MLLSRAILVAIGCLCCCRAVAAQDEADEKHHAHISGSFTDADGHPIAAVEYVSRCWPGTAFPSQSGADGRFESTIEWPAHVHDTWYEGTARAFGYAAWKTDCQLKPGQGLDVGRIRLEPG